MASQWKTPFRQQGMAYTHALLEEAAYTQQCMALPYLECCAQPALWIPNNLYHGPLSWPQYYSLSVIMPIALFIAEGYAL